MAVDMFLKIDGIDGESADDKHKKEIEVLSFSWGVNQPHAGAASTGGSHTTGRASFHEFSITKHVDISSPKLMFACAAGEHLKSIRLELCRAGGDKQAYDDLKFTDVLVTSYQTGAHKHGEELPTEEINFMYGKVEYKYTQTKVEGGKTAGNVATGWDLKSNKKV